MPKRFRLSDGILMERRQLIHEGRRLVVFDLGHDGEDKHLAQEHQEICLPGLLKVQPHTWFKIVAQRVYNGWCSAHRYRLSSDERMRRLRIAHGEIVGRVPTDATGAAKASLHLASAAASALVKRAAVRRD